MMVLVMTLALAGMVRAGNAVWQGNLSGTWDTSTANWITNGVAGTYTEGDAVIFDDTATTKAVSSGGTVSPASVTVSNTTTYTFTASIGGTAPLAKNNSGTLIFSAAQTYSGATTISGGTLQIGVNGSGTGAKLGNGNYSTNIFIAFGAELDFQSDANQTISGVISGSGTLYKHYSGTLTLSGSNTYSGKTTINGITTAGGGTLSVSSFNSVNGGTPLLASSSLGCPTTPANGTIDIGNNTQSSSDVLKYTGPGETTDRIINFFNNNGNSTRTFDVSGTGLLKFTTAPTGTTTGTITLKGSGAGEFVGGLPFGFNNLTKSDSGTWTLDGPVKHTLATTINAGTLELGGAGTLGTGIFAGNIANNGILRFNSTAIQTISGVISGSGALVKNNTGTLYLTSTNSYSGITAISNGTLLVNGSLSAASRVTIASGGTLGGTGTVGIVTNNGTISPGYSAVMGTLTTSNLVLNSGCTNVFDLNGINGGDTVTVNGGLTINGTPMVVVTVTDLLYGSYPLIVVSGSVPGTVPLLNVVSDKGVTSRLAWGGQDNKTLLLSLGAPGTVFMIR